MKHNSARPVVKKDADRRRDRLYDVSAIRIMEEEMQSYLAPAARRLAAALMALAAASAIAQEWKPARNVDIIVASAAAGSSDRTARVAQKLLQANPAFPSVSVTNRPGGGGTIAWSFLTQHPGDAHYIATFSATMLTNHLLGVSKLSYQDLTPLSILIREYILLAVRAESPIASAKDLLERLKKDVTSVSFAFSSSRGNHNHVMIGIIAKAAGADPKKVKVVIYNSGGDALTAMLGGHVDVLVGAPGGSIPHVETGKARAIGMTAAQRQPGRTAGVPTFRDSGIDAVFFSWRGFVAPKGLTPAQIAFWDQAFAKAVQAPEWKKDLEKNAWAEDLMTSAETRKHLDYENEVMSRLLADLGVITK
jgi:putative tricarboxylic transport membrane protein